MNYIEMKKVYALLATALLSTVLVAQPQKMSYQAVIRNAGNTLVTSHAVGIKISILQGSESGTAVYEETHTPTTNANGLVTIEIGSGTVGSGTFATIDWTTGTYYLKTETDPAGGTSYTITGKSQLLSVPYALYAKSAGTSDALKIQIKMLKISSAAGGTVTDVNSNVYNTVKIGTQVWMAENLKTTKYDDGTAIPNVTGNTEWAALTSGAYCDYSNTPGNSTTYGRLYNWYTIDAASNGSKSVCPAGWHVPTNGEWLVLTDYLTNNGYGYQGSGSDIAKSMASTSGWAADPTAGSAGNDKASNNSSGFSALPGGYRNNTGTYSNIGSEGSWWSSVEQTPNAFYRYISYDISNVLRNLNSTMSGFSVRCVQGEIRVKPTLAATKAASERTSTTATSGGNVTSDGGATITARGVCWGTTTGPTTASSKTTDSGTTGSFTSSITGLTATTTYYVRAYATNSFGTAYGTEVSFTTLQAGQLSDIDGNVYNSVTIGTQVWMKENLKTTKYNDGSSIPNVTADATWAALTTGAYSDYSNTPGNSTTYGRLYNWYAVDNNASTKAASNGGKNICPTGWHVPSEAEWTTLTTYLTNNGYGYGGSGNDIVKSMAATSGWTTTATAGAAGNDQASNNSSGFTALPGGYRLSYGAYVYVGGRGGWWSSTEYSTTYAWYRDMGYNSTNVVGDFGDKQDGFSVRCLRD
jgi:uncharacterized protein (TIGR02145 family)